MVAVMLSVMLLGSLIGVLRSMMQQAKQTDSYDGAAWRAECIDLIRRDLMAAESVWVEQDTIFLYSDPPNYQRANESVRLIGYRTSSLSTSRTMLERIEADQTRVVAIGPRKIRMERIDHLGSPQPLPPRPGPMPRQMHLWIWGETSDVPLVDLVVILQ